MIRAFNAVMRVISSLIGVLMVLMGGIWIVQGLNLSLQCHSRLAHKFVEFIGENSQF